jgi:phage terminase large subunit GpA-like protein
MIREYVKTRSRNEALDLEVYSLAALYTVSNQKLRTLGEAAEELNEPLSPDEVKSQVRQKVGIAAQSQGESQANYGLNEGSGWVNGWRD